MVKCVRCGTDRKNSTLKEGQKTFSCRACYFKNHIVTYFNFPSGNRIVKAGCSGFTDKFALQKGEGK